MTKGCGKLHSSVPTICREGYLCPECQEEDEVEFSLTGKERSGMSNANYDFTIFEGVSG